MVDATGNQWTTAFNEEAEKMLGSTAQELGELKDQDSNEFQRKMNECSYKNFLVKIRVRQETYMVGFFIFKIICHVIES